MNDSQTETERFLPGRSPMLLLKLSESKQKAFAYAFLLKIDYVSSNGDDAIHLDYGFCVVSIAGSGLGDLHLQLCEHNVKSIPVIGAAQIESNRGGVSGIEIVPRKPDES